MKIPSFKMIVAIKNELAQLHFTHDVSFVLLLNFTANTGHIKIHSYLSSLYYVKNIN